MAEAQDSPITCTADIDGDFQVTVTDLLALLGSFGSTAGGASDINGNGSVEVTDLLALLGEFGATCSSSGGAPLSCGSLSPVGGHFHSNWGGQADTCIEGVAPDVPCA